MNTLIVSPVHTDAARAALRIAGEYYSPALLNHAVRSYHWAAVLAQAEDIAVDDELLFVAAMLHDFGLVPEFDSYALDFEYAGGHIAVVFAAGAGWAQARARRVQEIIVRHMGDQVDVGTDPEGHLLHRATGIDITGREADLLPTDVRAQVLSQWPRLGLAEEFTHCFEQQAVRKPRSTAAVALRHGLATKLRENPLGA
ncbi:HD domain-containing protein [Nocardia altamirensis]|uniref:HD domain-containing protein n=1 Tax=Nocardia altamirensis TaxID=472158 RepID=UPI0008408043|nr:HD domain-containing protein [Nocardia altamirensis]